MAAAGVQEQQDRAQKLSLKVVESHNQEGDFWVVVDSYVLDLSDFLAHHPGTTKKIMDKRQAVGADITSNFLDHFGWTVKTFRDACQEFERKQQPVSIRFREVKSAEALSLANYNEPTMSAMMLPSWAESTNQPMDA
eukprot:CAMPEP_0117569658 /NCGR_PEP_ID=MMETSP0784-20121206/58776_1 /TAXON_ID=39447 /ORGANISM="" /LENGTH=136 /DNA_ID=CAMNT_0005367647 /DNA_START=40 /DNA_END=451 /DNA_ORIENTATION=+